MKKIARPLALVLLAVTSLTACSGAVPTNELGADGVHGSVASAETDDSTEAKDATGVSQNALGTSSGDLGQGYDSINRTIKPMYCVTPTATKEVGAASSSVAMTLASDRVEVARSLGLDIEASYGIYSAAASFMRETKTDDRSVSYVFGGTMAFKDIQMGPEYNVTSQAKGITDAVTWSQYCGDSFVGKITRGASLYTNLKLAFSSAEEKQSFEANFKASGGLGVSAALKAAQKVASQSVQVKVNAVQVGGDVSQLPHALEGTDVAACSMGDFASCLGFVTNVEKYAANQFPLQFKDASGKPLSGSALDGVTATTGYETHPWTDLRIANVPDLANLGPQATETLRLVQTQFAAKSKIDGILQLTILPNRGAQMAAKQRSALAGDQFIVDQNVSSLKDAWNVCAPKATSSCASTLAAAKASLKSPVAEDLAPWFDAQLPNGSAMPAWGFVDLRGDGHTDACFRDGVTVSCQMGIGGGFSDTRTVVGGLEFAGEHAPGVWLKLRPGSNEQFLCGPSGTLNNVTQGYCVPMSGGVPHGIINIEKLASVAASKFKTPATKTGTADTRGMDPNVTYDRVEAEMNKYFPSYWQH